jgi:hypothetical protein
MSYPAILSTPSSVSSVSSVPRPSQRNAQRHHRSHHLHAWAESRAHPSQLLDWLSWLSWLRLAVRDLCGPSTLRIPGMLGTLGTSETIGRIEPYRACNRCVSQIRWCGEGVRGYAEHQEPLETSRPMKHAELPERPEPVQFQQLPQPPHAPKIIAPGPGISPLASALLLGARADPYPLAESVQKRTRGLLEWVARLPYALEVSILTRSLLLLRDLDLLVELDQRHAVTVSVLIPAADPKLAGRLDRGGHRGPRCARGDQCARCDQCDRRHRGHPVPPASPDRFDLVRILAAHGIATQVLCTPIVPGRNNGAAALHRLFDLARQSGASDVVPAPRHPALAPTRAESQHLLALFRRLRLEHGFPRALAGRG